MVNRVQSNQKSGIRKKCPVISGFAVQLRTDFTIITNLNGKNLRKEIAYGITGLSNEKAKPEKVLDLVRNHWSIENSLHWLRDVTFNEDRSQVRTVSSPRIMASLRNLVISLFRRCGSLNIAESLRFCN
jgi:hypothetical protein